MKTNPETDGEYTDVEPESGETTLPADAAVASTEVEGEYTDSDTPDESNPQGGSVLHR